METCLLRRYCWRLSSYSCFKVRIDMYHNILVDEVHAAHRLYELSISIQLNRRFFKLENRTGKQSLCLLHMLSLDLGIHLKPGISFWQSDHWLKLSDCDSVRVILVLGLVLYSQFNIVLSQQLSSLMRNPGLDFFGHSDVLLYFCVWVLVVWDNGSFAV